MEKRNYTHVQMLLPEIEAMIAEGKTQREVAEHFGFKDKYVVKKLLKRQREKQRKLEAGIVPRSKGRPRKDAVQDQIHCLLCPSLVSHNAVVVEVTDHRQVQHSLFGMDIRNVRDPFTVRLVCVKLSIQQILILVELLPHLSPFPGAANFRQ